MRRKLTDYSLNRDHEAGGPKARGFELILGITLDDVEHLAQSIEAEILTAGVESVRPNPPHGVNCIVVVPVRGLRGKSARIVSVRTAWEIVDDRGRTTPCERIPETLHWRMMASVKHAIGENDFIELLDRVGKWAPGTVGTVVIDHGNSKLIEISDDRGVMLELVEVAENRLRLITKHSG